MNNKIIKTIKLLVIISFVLACQTITIPQKESKSINTTLNNVLDLNAMAIKYEEINLYDLYSVKDVYNGSLTGYAANCPLCGGTLGCNGQNVLDGTTEYQDDEYGTVKIVASSKSLPCGSIVQFNVDKISNNTITAIVLDRGVTGTNLDLLVESEDYAIHNIGRINISYNILRFGWNKSA